MSPHDDLCLHLSVWADNEERKPQGQSSPYLVELLRKAAFALSTQAARPAASALTCATCQHWDGRNEQTDMQERGLCLVDTADYHTLAFLRTKAHFGCTLYAALPMQDGSSR